MLSHTESSTHTDAVLWQVLHTSTTSRMDCAVTRLFKLITHLSICLETFKNWRGLNYLDISFDGHHHQIPTIFFWVFLSLQLSNLHNILILRITCQNASNVNQNFVIEIGTPFLLKKGQVKKKARPSILLHAYCTINNTGIFNTLTYTSAILCSRGGGGGGRGGGGDGLYV